MRRIFDQLARTLVVASVVGFLAPTVLPHAIDLDHGVEAASGADVRLHQEPSGGEHGHCLVCHFLRDLRAAHPVTGTPLPAAQPEVVLLHPAPLLASASHRTGSPSRAPPVV